MAGYGETSLFKLQSLLILQESCENPLLFSRHVSSLRRWQWGKFFWLLRIPSVIHSTNGLFIDYLQE